METVIIIPARYKSSRFPGKPLADIYGKPMIQHVYEQASRASCAKRVIVATDDWRIDNVVKKFGGESVMTSPDHISGTDRMIEVAESIKADVYINVQGDEPLISPGDIDLVAETLYADKECMCATLCHVINAEEAENINMVKVTVTHENNALYFSRLPIPFSDRDNKNIDYLRHVGLYGYRSEILFKYMNLPKSDLEKRERLEQLRLLEAGIPIRVIKTKRTGPGVDTPQCLEEVKKIMSGDYIDQRIIKERSA